MAKSKTKSKVNITLRKTPLNQTKVNLILKKPSQNIRVPGVYVKGNSSKKYG